LDSVLEAVKAAGRTAELEIATDDQLEAGTVALDAADLAP
jgi:hypothetical protein